MDSFKRFACCLSLTFLVATNLTQAEDTMQAPTPPQPPEVPALPSVPAQGNASSSQSFSQQQFMTNDMQVEIQVAGKTPTVNAQDDTQLDFPATGEIRATIQRKGETQSTTLTWNSAGCTSTKAGSSQVCTSEERRQIIQFIKQLPTPPTPPNT